MTKSSQETGVVMAHFPTNQISEVKVVADSIMLRMLLPQYLIAKAIGAPVDRQRV